MASDPDDTAVRSTLGSYRLLGEIGRDPLGVLHLACPAGARSFPKWAVVRRMHAGLARDPVMVHAFLAATQAAVRMVHKNIATCFDFGGKMTLPWVAREHLFGATMLELIAQLTATSGKLPWSLAVHIVAEAAEGVAAVRARLPAYGPPMGFLTGAVVPSVFLTESGDVKIVDGCLSLIEGLPLVDSEALPYRPRGPAPVGPNAGRSDAFGLGVLLWELVSGRRLFAGQDDDETNRLVDASVVPLLRTTARAPGFVDDVVQRAVRGFAGGREGVATALELATDLRAGLSAEGMAMGSDEVAHLVKRTFPEQLEEQRDLLEDAWLREQMMQQEGELPPDVSSDGDLTRPNSETVRDTTTETAISRRPGSMRDGFDEVPTIARSRPPGPSSWRPEAPALLSVAPRISYLPDPSPPPPPPAPPPPSSRSAGPMTPAVLIDPPPPSFRLPPVERAPVTQPSHGLIVTPPRPPRAEAQPSAMMMAAIGLGVALALVLAVGLYRDASPDFTAGPPTPTPLPSHSAASSAGRPPGPWTALPPAPIPVISPDDLPRAPEVPPDVISHRPSPARSNPAARLGLLTVFCTPACDSVTDGARALGPSPVFKVPAMVGVHRLRLRVDALPAEKTVSVTVREGDTTVVRETLGE
jgi:serine/threonine-protein kinase